MNIRVLFICSFLLLIFTVSLLFIIQRESYDLEMIYEKAQIQKVKLSRGYTHYKYFGENNRPLIVMLHGMTIPAWGWGLIIPDLVKRGYSVLVYDRYGRGYSERVKEPLSMNIMVDQLFELLTALNISEPFHIVGHSMGSVVATQFAIRYPEKTKRVVLSSPLIDLSKQGYISLLMKIPFVSHITVKWLLVPHMLRRGLKLLYYKDEQEKYHHLFKQQFGIYGTGRSLQSLFLSDLIGDYRQQLKELSRLPMKIGLVYGEQDELIGDDSMKDFKAIFSGQKLIKMKCGHNIRHCDPKAYTNHLVDLISQ